MSTRCFTHRVESGGVVSHGGGGVMASPGLAAHFQNGKQQLADLPKVAKLSERVTVLLGMNPAAYSLQGTNCYLIGQGTERVLLDTGEGKPEFFQNLLQVLRKEACKITSVILTHSHVDHIGGLPALLHQFPDLLVWRCRPPPKGLCFGRLGTAEDATDPSGTLGLCSDTNLRYLQDGEVIKVNGITLRAVHTPGHASDHLCFWLEEEEALFTGDHILGTGTVIVDDLDAYMSSLQKLNELRPERIYPGHGPMLEGVAAKQRPAEYIHHRQLRLKKAVELLESSQNSSLEQLLYGVYGSSLPSDAFLQHAARRNLEASLEKLEKDGLARKLSGSRWASSKMFKASRDSTKPLESPSDISHLRRVLQRARPSWTLKDLVAAESKLHGIQVMDAKVLGEELQQGTVNEKLRKAGYRLFTQETLEALHQTLKEADDEKMGRSITLNLHMFCGLVVDLDGIVFCSYLTKH